MDGYTLSISRCSGGDGVEESFNMQDIRSVRFTCLLVCRSAIFIDSKRGGKQSFPKAEGTSRWLLWMLRRSAVGQSTE